MKAELHNIPATVPYLSTTQERIALWKQRLGPGGFKVGINWQGRAGAKIDAGRSFALKHFERLAGMQGVRLISLQKGDGVDQLLHLPAAMAVELLGDGFDAGPNAFADSAAVIQCLDLVITSDTAIAHLAGALGCPTWVALKYVPDWRWMLEGESSPWYPSMRLFRQQRMGEWDGVFEDMHAALLARNDK